MKYYMNKNNYTLQFNWFELTEFFFWEFELVFLEFLGSLFNHYAEQQQQLAQIPAGLQQQILQIASMPTIQTTHVPSVVSTPVPIQPKPTPKPIAPATMNPSIIPHKQSFQSKV